MLIELITAETDPSPPLLSVKAGAAPGHGANKITHNANFISLGRGMKKYVIVATIPQIIILKLNGYLIYMG